MAQAIKLFVNGKPVSVSADDPDMPLLYALRDNLGLHGPRFGCGLGNAAPAPSMSRAGHAILHHAASAVAASKW